MVNRQKEGVEPNQSAVPFWKGQGQEAVIVSFLVKCQHDPTRGQLVVRSLEN